MIEPIDGWAAISAHIRAGDLTELRAALLRGADPNVADPMTRETALMTAILAGNRDALEALLDAGADPDQRDGYGDTALHIAGKVDEVAALILLERGATAEARNALGATFQQYAAMTSYELLSDDAKAARSRVVEWLGTHGFDVHEELQTL